MIIENYCINGIKIGCQQFQVKAFDPLTLLIALSLLNKLMT